MVTSRAGINSLGCLMSIALIAILVVVGKNVGRVYWRYYQFRDDVRQAAQFGGHFTNQQIMTSLAAQADSLDLPEEATNVMIRRDAHSITIESDYSDHLSLPLFSRDVHFVARADGTF
ncbi:MAG TPA: hypothetical protein VMH39_03290 [Gemmatimonadaceae bacterium]|nr:hypothetical protein [Gemmatimonadaceae bacterium]